MKKYIRSNKYNNAYDYMGDTSYLRYDYDEYNVYDDLDDAKSVVDNLRNKGYCATINTRYSRSCIPEGYAVIYWKC